MTFTINPVNASQTNVAGEDNKLIPSCSHPACVLHLPYQVSGKKIDY